MYVKLVCQIIYIDFYTRYSWSKGFAEEYVTGRRKRFRLYIKYDQDE